MSFVKLSSMPAPRKTYSFHFPALNGGLNLRDAEINLNANESPEIVNLWWDDGVLQSRPGQERVTSGWRWDSATYGSFTASDIPYAAAPFQEGFVVHIGGEIFTSHREGADFYPTLRSVWGTNRQRYRNVPLAAGTFFRFGLSLFYKNPGGFYRLSYNSAHASGSPPLTLRDMSESGYVPTIVINANPATGSGDLYQPENRLSDYKRVRYNASTTPSTIIQTGDGVKRAFTLGVTSAEHLFGLSSVYINDSFTESALYSFDAQTGTVIFNSAPPVDSTITFIADMGNCEYHLPVENVDAVTLVKQDSLYLIEGLDYTVNTATGIVTFKVPPPVTDPPTNNTVEITYRKANASAKNAVMNCRYASAYGTGKELCILWAGNPDQPNAVYWSGTSGDGFDPSYWPVNQYNLLGDTADPVTGFGKQYGDMIVFKDHSIGKLDLSIESVNGRDTISLTYTGVNDKIGCDCPQSIQLIENNLTFANTSGGVYQVMSSSAAYENNVKCISDKINGSDTRPGLLYDLRVAGGAGVRSFDDGKRYWLAVNGHIWLWDYSISTSDNPVWFFFTDMDAQLLVTREKELCLINRSCETVKLGNTYSDFGGAIRKVYQFPVRNFGGYDRLKDVRSLLISMRADTPSNTEIIYETDYESRKDRCNLIVTGYDRLTERNLAVRNLSVPRHSAVFRREPECMDVRHFSLRLEDNTAGSNLAVYSAELQYRYAGRER